MKYGEIMKKILLCLIILAIPFFALSEANAKSLSTGEYVLLTNENEKPDLMENTCQDFSNVLRMIGMALILVKIAVPLIIIVKSTLNLFTAVTSGKPEELKKQINKLVTSCLAGILIFFTPTIVYLAMGLTDTYGKNITPDANVCKNCLLRPAECNAAKEKAKFDLINGIQSVVDNAKN